MEQKKHIDTIAEIDMVFETEDRIVIYGAGDYGKRLVDYITARGENQEKILSFLVTEKKENDSGYQNVAVKEARDFLVDRECFVIVAVSDRYQEDVVKIVEYYHKRYCCLTEDLYKAFIKELEVPYHGLDFLLAGFPKCATTSLNGALRKIDDVYVPDGKETFIYKWYDEVDDPQSVLAKKYYNSIRKGQLVGMIETGIYEWKGGAGTVYDNFGPQLKLLFLVRNPVEAAFSEFRMMVRNGDEYCDNAYEGYQNFSMEMFDKFIDDSVEKDIFNYIGWIRECAQYYPDKQIKVILYEELIKSTDKAMNDILEFIGSKCKYRSGMFPFWNRGNSVPANKDGWEKGKRRNELHLYPRYNPQVKEDMTDRFLQSKQEYEAAEKIYDPQMSQEQRKRLEAYYNSSVRELEKFLGRSLSEVWF